MGASGHDVQAGLALLQGLQLVVHGRGPVDVEHAAQNGGVECGPGPQPGAPPPSRAPEPAMHSHQLFQLAAGLPEALGQLQDAWVAEVVVAEVQLA